MPKNPIDNNYRNIILHNNKIPGINTGCDIKLSASADGYARIETRCGKVFVIGPEIVSEIILGDSTGICKCQA